MDIRSRGSVGCGGTLGRTGKWLVRVLRAFWNAVDGLTPMKDSEKSRVGSDEDNPMGRSVKIYFSAEKRRRCPGDMRKK